MYVSMNRFFLVLFLLFPAQSLFAADVANVSSVVQGILSHESESDRKLNVFVHRQIRELNDEGKLALYTNDKMQVSERLPVIAYFILHEYRTRDKKKRKNRTSVLAENINNIAAMAQRACLWDVVINRKNNDEKEITLEHQLTGEQVVTKADCFQNVPLLQNCADDCGISVASDKLLTQGVSSILCSDSAGDVKLLMQVLKLVSEEDQEKLTEQINALSDEQLNRLYKKADYLNLAGVQKLCAARIAKELKEIELTGIETLPVELEHEVKQLLDVKPLFDAMQSRIIINLDLLLLKTDMRFRSICCNKLQDVLWIGLNRRVLRYDVKKRLIEDIGVRLLARENINSVAYNKVKNEVLIGTNYRALVYNIENKLIVEHAGFDRPFEIGNYLFFECITSVIDSKVKNELLITTNKRVLRIHDIENKSIIENIEFEFCGCERSIESVIDSKVKNEILIRTNYRVLIYDVKKKTFKNAGFEGQYDELIRSINYNRAEDELLIATNKRVLIYDIENKSIIKDIDIKFQEDDPVYSAVYNKAEDELLVKTTRRVLIYNLVKGVLKEIIFKRQQGEFIRSIDYNRAEDGLLIGTNKRILLLPLSHRLLPQLSLNQLKFLMYKALPAWQSKQPYMVTKEEKEIYVDLPDCLKWAQFFDDELLHEEKEASGCA
ncbi:MAG: hypothetical protein WD055_02125 [Candidatus Dependentiae bacterium]